MNPLFLVIDQGGQSTRVGVYTEAGHELCLFATPCETVTTSVGHQRFIEQDPEAIVHGIQQSLQCVVDFLGADVSRIVAAGYAGQGSSLLAWDYHSMAPFTNVISWQDVRGEGYLPLLANSDVLGMTGLRASAHYGATKFRWCLDHLPCVQQAAQQGLLRIGPVVTYVLQRLTGHAAPVDAGHAQRTLLWNCHTREWDQRLLDAFGIPRAALPACVPHRANFGVLRLGDHDVPVVACARDQGASLFAQGMPDPLAVYVNMGTGVFVQQVAHTQLPPEGLLMAPVWSDGKGSVLNAIEATVNGAASALNAISRATGLRVTPDVMESALRMDLGNEGWCLNAEGGLGAPYWSTSLSTQFAPQLTPLEKIAAWLESILFLVAINMQRLPQAPSVIYVSGGFSGSDVLCQRLASITGVTVKRRDTREATLRGIAYLTANCPEGWEVDGENARFLPLNDEKLQQRFYAWGIAMKRWLDGDEQKDVCEKTT